MLDKILRILDLLLWVVAFGVALVFIAIKARNWGPLSQMEQFDFAVYYMGSLAGQISPENLYNAENWSALTGLDLKLAGTFLYSPTIAWLFSPLTRVPFPQATQVWLMLNGLVAASIFVLLLRLWYDRRANILGAVLWLLLPATLDTAYLGNLNLLLALLVTFSVWAFGRTILTSAIGGLVLGFAAAIKPFPFGLVLIGIWGRRWLWAIMAGVGWLICVFAVYPFYHAAYPGYWNMLLQNLIELAPPGAGIIQNQSIIATWQKLAFDGTLGLAVHDRRLETLAFSPLLSPEMARTIGWVSAFVVGVVLLWALWRLKRDRPDAAMLAWGILLTSMLILSPVSWMLYVVIIAPVYPALMNIRHRLTPAWRLLIPIGYLTILMQRGYVFWLPYMPLLALTSTILFGLVAWWAVFLHCIVRKAPAPSATAAAQALTSPVIDGLSMLPTQNTPPRFFAGRVLALGALLISWVFLLWQLSPQSMWIDEWFTQARATDAWDVLIANVIASERRPPLHYILVKLWSELAGDNEYVMRLFSIAAVLLSGALVFALGKRLLGRSGATWALWLLALSPFWLLYGRMIRAYSLTMALALLLTWLLLQVLRRGGWWWLAYVLAGTALLYTDYSGLAVVAAHGLVMLCTLRVHGWRKVGGWFAAAAVMGLAFTPWLAVVAVQVARDVRVTDLAGGPVGFALKLVTPFFVWGAGESIYPWNPLGLAGAAAAGLLWLWGLVAAFRRRRDRFWLLLWSFAMPLLFTATLLTLIATDITFLNAAARSPAAAPFFYLAAANGLVNVRRRWLRWGAALLILAGFAAATVNYYRGEQLLNPIYVVPARAVAAGLAQEAGANDLILAEPDTLVGYYYRLAPGAATYRDLAPGADADAVTSADPETVYVVTFGRDSTASSYATDQLAAWLAQHYQLAAEQGYGPVAPLYQAVKQRITGRPAYAYKLTVQKYVQP